MSELHGEYVTEDNGPRPAGPPDECFYCHRPIGEKHDVDECPCVTRTVTVRMTVEYPIEVPAGWDREQTEFHRNMGTWCSDNALPELGGLSEDEGCICPFTVFEYVNDGEPTDATLQSLHQRVRHPNN